MAYVRRISVDALITGKLRFAPHTIFFDLIPSYFDIRLRLYLRLK
jgi:hypothetical protein